MAFLAFVPSTPDVRIRVPAASPFHPALIDAVGTLARRRGMGDEIAERLSELTARAAATAATADPDDLELVVSTEDHAVAITVGAIGAKARVDQIALHELMNWPTAESVTSHVDGDGTPWLTARHPVGPS